MLEPLRWMRVIRSAHEVRISVVKGWLRALLAIDRGVRRGVIWYAAARDELAWALTSPRDRAAVTEAIYDRAVEYAPGGATFARGLTAWEEQLLAHPAIPRTGRVLLGGAGGGRELRALQERGYTVAAFEPSAKLAQAAPAPVLRGRYQDLDAALRGEGPLAPLREARPFAFVLLGWRSLSHVLGEEERAALFATLAQLAPGAPVIASFVPRLQPRGRVQLAIRQALAVVGGEPPAGAAFVPWAGFAVELDRDDLTRAAAAGGYRVAEFAVDPDGYALLSRR
jgi:hypothetical protein